MANELIARVTKLETVAEKARALNYSPFGNHGAGCLVVDYDLTRRQWGDCDCGLEQLRKALGELDDGA